MTLGSSVTLFGAMFVLALVPGINVLAVTTRLAASGFIHGVFTTAGISDALASVLEEGQSTLPYWVQTGLIATYFVVLLVLYLRDNKEA